MGEKNNSRGALLNKIVPAVLVLLGGALIFYCLWTYIPALIRPKSTPQTPPPFSSSIPEEENDLVDLPAGAPVLFPQRALFVTDERLAYEDGSMILKVPAMGVDTPIADGADDASLNRSPGLYDKAQLPGEALVLKEPALGVKPPLAASTDKAGWRTLYDSVFLPGQGNPNVSIAGHRDVHGSPFYTIDKLGDGDLFYLIYRDTLFRYIYESTEIVTADNWFPISCREFSALTLTSCDPIGTSLNRIIVTARFLDASPYAGETVYPANLAEPQDAASSSAG